MNRTKQLIGAAFVLLAVILTAVQAVAATRVDRHVMVDGFDRRYVAFLPDGSGPGAALPVVLAFHGGYGDPDQFASLTGLAQAPAARNTVIVFPEGYRRSWNEGGVCCGPAMGRVDDVKFVRTLLDDLDWLVRLDRRRVYATGWSNGGGMSYYLACAMSEEITAISPVSAAMREPKAACHPQRPVPVLDWHGLQDRVSPYNGEATSARGFVPPPPVPETIAFWAQVDGTQTVTHVSRFGGEAECDVHAGGRDGAVVEDCRIPGMGHRWAGAHPTAETERGDGLIKRFVGDLGPYAPAVDANDAMLRFFAGFALPARPGQ